MRVLLLDEGFPGGAYVAVSLRDAGADVTVLAGTGGTGGHRERGLLWTLGPRVGSPGYVDAVDHAVRERRADRVFAVTEPVLYRLWDAAPPWEEKLFPPVERAMRPLLRSKQALAEHLAARGMAIPRHRRVSGAEGVAAAVEELGLPVVVKGTTGRGGTSTAVARSLAEARAAAARMAGGEGGCFVQEHVRGHTFLAGGLFHEGRPLRLYAGEKVAQHPPETGPAIHLRSTDDTALMDAALAVFRELRWTGVASADFIRRPADGAFLFLEVNPRPWGSIGALEGAGVELFEPLVRLMRGEVPEARTGFRAGEEFTVFPLWMMSGAYGRGAGALARVARDLRGPLGKVWRDPRRFAHLANRILQVKRNWAES